jgi:hypothetical protein
VNTHPGDQMPDRVTVDDLLDGRANLHLQNLGRDRTLMVQVRISFLNSEQSSALAPAIADRHAQTPNIRLEPVVRVLPHFNVHLILIESIDHLRGEICHCSRGVAGFQGGRWEVGVEWVQPGVRETVVADDEVFGGRDEDVGRLYVAV